MLCPGYQGVRGITAELLPHTACIGVREKDSRNRRVNIYITQRKARSRDSKQNKAGWGLITGRRGHESGMRQEADGSSTGIIGKISSREEEVGRVKRKQSGRVGPPGAAGVGSQLARLPDLQEQGKSGFQNLEQTGAIKGTGPPPACHSLRRDLLPPRDFRGPSPAGRQTARGPGWCSLLGQPPVTQSRVEGLRHGPGGLNGEGAPGAAAILYQGWGSEKTLDEVTWGQTPEMFSPHLPITLSPYLALVFSPIMTSHSSILCP